MGSLRSWWQRMTGGGTEPTAPPAGGHPAGRARPASESAKPQPAGQLQLTDPPRKGPPGRVAEAGFDPYGNDAGYAKPHGWEKVARN